jgi:uncharacterized protein
MPSEQLMQEYVITMLKENLPECYQYHNYAHTLYVLDKVIEIGDNEKCTEQEIHLLKVAALWHDTGYIKSYANHELTSCLLAKEQLPAYGFTSGEIAIICGMIMATKIPQTPKTKLEEIIADADLEYLGTKEAEEKATLLFHEIHSLIPSITKAAWDKMQLSFLQTHRFFTLYCQQQKEPIKQTYLKKLLGIRAEGLY